jgi:hypothetical protein
MANHERQTIREAVVAALMGNTAAGSRVFASREVPWKRVELPGLAVYALDEAVEPQEWRGDSRRRMTLAVLAVVMLTERVDEALDALALEVETILMATPTLGGAHDIRYSGTQIGLDEEQGRPMGVARLTFDVVYFPGGRQ